MPKSAPRPCTQARCTKYATKGGRCEDHQHKAWLSSEGKTSSQRGYGYKWQKLRTLVLKRDKHLCIECLKQGIYTKAQHVDHILNKAQCGDDNLNNLQSLCYNCHKIKTAEEAKNGRYS